MPYPTFFGMVYVKVEMYPPATGFGYLAFTFTLELWTTSRRTTPTSAPLTTQEYFMELNGNALLIGSRVLRRQKKERLPINVYNQDTQFESKHFGARQFLR